MFFSKKNKNIKCENCSSNINEKFNFCPHCGASTMSEMKEKKEFGLIGRNDFTNQSEKKQQNPNSMEGFGITDQILNSMLNKMIKSFDKQFKSIAEPEMQSGASIEQYPNGIKISVGIPRVAQAKEQKPKSHVRKQITEKQAEKMSTLPRAAAKTSMRRLSDKIIYELAASGIESPEDVFISKLESGYEIKAIGKKKVYVNSLPINLPIRGFALADNKLLVEFKIER